MNFCSFEGVTDGLLNTCTIFPLSPFQKLHLVFLKNAVAIKSEKDVMVVCF